jgi:hypothetical protein
VCGLLLLLAAVAHERAAETCVAGGGRWELVHFACAAQSARDVEGVALRRAIDAEFRHRRDDSMLNGAGGDPNVISSVVQASIPPGTAFEHAEDILRAAGFKVKPLGPCAADDAAPPRGQCMHARIDDYAFALFGSTTVDVVLEGDSGSTVVHTLSAEIVVDRLL